MADAQAGSNAGRYEILAKLSQSSGTAELFAARASGVERLVVIKRLRREAAKEKAVAQAFLAEARVAAKLAHPNVAQVFEVGKLGGSYFFTTEYVDGETIRALISHARGKKIQVPIRAFLTIAAGAAAGLHHAHERNGMDGKSLNIIHGDISPTNVMISRDGIVKVLDFGMARGRGPTKLSYASPEQVRGDKLDRRSDLFSLGVVLWELLTLGDLHERPTDEETRQAIENDDTPSPSLRRFDVPPELDQILVKLLAKKPDARYQTGGELLAAIESLSTKLGFSLSTNDLARMMRLWFGPPAAGSEPDDLKPVEVTSEDILAEASPNADPVDELLGTVREAAAKIRALAQRIGGPRGERPPTQPPTAGEVENARENFAQIRDRILEQARKRKETMRPPLSGQASAVGATPPSGVPAAASASGDSSDARKKPETLTPTNPYAYITKVAETASAPTKATTAAADASAALKALDAATAAAEAHAEGDSGANGALPPAGRAVTATYDAAAAAAAGEAAVAAAAAARAADEAKSTSGELATKSSDAAATNAARTEAKVEVAADKADAKSDTTSKVEAKTETKSEAKTTDTESKSAKNAADDDKPAVSRTASKSNGVSAKPAVNDEQDDEDDAKESRRAVAARVAVDADEHDQPAASSPLPKWLVPALLAVAVVLILIFVLKGGKNESSSAKHDQVAQNQGANTRTVTNTANPNTGTTGTGTGAGTTNTGTGTTNTGTGTTNTGTTMTGSAATGSATTMQTPVDAAVVVTPPVDAPAVAVAPPDAAVVATNDKTNTGDKTGTKTGDKTNTGDKTGTKTNTGDKTGDKTNTGDKTGTKTGDKTGTKSGDKTNTGDKTGTKTEPAKDVSIEDLYAKGDYAATNKACTKNLIFSPSILQACALAACRSSNTALAKRWVNAISKAARPDIISQCKGFGLDLEAPPPADGAAPPAP